MEVAIEPKSARDREKLAEALAHESLSAKIDRESGHTLLGGASELEFDAIIETLKTVHNVELTVGVPLVAYREKLGRAATIDYTHKRQGASPQFARVVIAFAPANPGSGFTFRNTIIDDAALNAYAPSIERGLLTAKDNGLLAGFPVIDFTASLIGGAHQDGVSNEQAFQIAVQAAFRELKAHGDPRLLEPVMKLQLKWDEEHVAPLISDLGLRRGVIENREARGDTTLIIAHAPLANLFGYTNTLSRLTQGRASCIMEFSHYQEVPISPNAPDLPPAQAAALRA